MSVDLSKLPLPNVIEELSYDAILAEHVADLVALDPSYSGIDPTDPGYAVLEVGAYRELHLRAQANARVRAILAAYATEEDLDQIGANHAIPRLVLDPGDPEAIPPVPPTYESDDAFRLRIAAGPEGYSVAGPRGAYEWHARTVAGVVDARSSSPSPGEIVVALLGPDGAPESGVVDAVDEVLNDDEIRPLCDNVTVQAATITNYTIDVDLYLYPGPEIAPVLAAATAALEAYAATQQRIGRDVRRSAIFAAAHVEGVQRVEITSPAADIVLGDTAASVCTSVTVAHGGTDE